MLAPLLQNVPYVVGHSMGTWMLFETLRLGRRPLRRSSSPPSWRRHRRRLAVAQVADGRRRVQRRCRPGHQRGDLPAVDVGGLQGLLQDDFNLFDEYARSPARSRCRPRNTPPRTRTSRAPRRRLEAAARRRRPSRSTRTEATTSSSTTCRCAAWMEAVVRARVRQVARAACASCERSSSLRMKFCPVGLPEPPELPSGRYAR